MDVFLDRVQALDDSWQGEGAAASVELTVGGEPVELAEDGGFELPRFGLRASGSWPSTGPAAGPRSR